MKSRIAIALLLAAALAACEPGVYTEGEETVTEPATAHFEFNVERCGEHCVCTFNLHDESLDVPVRLSGHVMTYLEPEGESAGCVYYARIDYVSDNPDTPGEGHALICIDAEPPAVPNADVAFGHARITVESGPYAGYANDGPVFGVREPGPCEAG